MRNRVLVRAALALVAVAATQLAVVEPASAATTGRLKHRATNLCLDASVSQGVRLNSCNTSAYQHWTYTDDEFLKNAATGYCLDGSMSQGVQIKPCNIASDYQWWNRQGLYFNSHAYDFQSLDASTSQGVRLNGWNVTPYQQWDWY